MRILFILSFFFLFSNSKAQNWELVAKGNVYYYGTKDGVTVQSISRDSVSLNNGDSLFWFRKTFFNEDSCDFNCYTRLVPNILGIYILKMTGGTFKIINDTSTFTVLPYAEVNDSWAFRTTPMVSAMVLGKSEGIVLGIKDSIKTILIGSDDTMQISKNFGIIKLPRVMHNFYLTGIAGNKNLGYSNKSLIDYFDFGSGDVIQYTSYFIRSTTGDEGSSTWKLKVIGRQIVNNSIKFDVNGYYLTEYHNIFSSYPPAYHYTRKLKNFTITEGEDFFCTDSSFVINTSIFKNPGEVVFMSVQDSFFGNFCRIQRVIDPDFGLKGKQMGYNFKSAPGDYYNFKFRQNKFIELNGPFKMIIADTIGLTLRDDSKGEVVSYVKLQGFIRNKKLVGIVTPDSLLVGIKPEQSLYENITLYPNPAMDRTVIYSGSSGICRIYDLKGNGIMKVHCGKGYNDINLQGIPAGMYLVEFTGEEEKLTGRTKLIISPH